MAVKKNKTSTRQDTRLKEDIASFKSSVAFILFCAVIFLTVNYLPFSRDSIHLPLRVFIENNPWILAIFVALFGFACLLRYKMRKSGKDESFSYFSSTDFFIISLFLLIFLFTFILTYHLSVLVSVIVGFAIVYYVQQFFEKDFLLITFLNLDIALGLWLIFGTTGTTGGLSTLAKIIFVAAVPIGFAVICYELVTLLRNKKKTKEKKLCIIPAGITLILGVVLAALMVFAGSTFSILVCELILLAQYVGLGIYYTVRLLNQ